MAKAKALKLFIEPIITKSKTDSTHNRRIVFKYLRNKYAVTELFREIAVKIGDRLQVGCRVDIRERVEHGDPQPGLVGAGEGLIEDAVRAPRDALLHVASLNTLVRMLVGS